MKQKQNNTLHRHDILDRAWKIIEHHLPWRAGTKSRSAKDNRKFINAVIWILQTGAPWRDLPPEYGDWNNTHRRFTRWRDKGIWAKLFEIVKRDPDFEWLMIDASYVKVHSDASGAAGGNQDMVRIKGGSTQK